MPSDSSDDGLVFILEARIKGASAINAGVAAANNWSMAENKVQRQMRESLGPYQKRIELQRKLNEAIEKGAASAKIADAKYAVFANQRQIDRIQKIGQTPSAGEALRNAFFSSRFGSVGGVGGARGVGFQPLVGRALDIAGPGAKAAVGDAIAGIGDMLGPEGILVAQAVKPLIESAIAAAKAVYDLADQSTKTTQAFADSRAMLGGGNLSTANALMLSRVTGVDAGSAARSLRERITSDPMSMAIAAQNGVQALPGIYGRRNFGDQYQQLISRLASNPNTDAAMRQADQLGIGQEVQRYRMLSPQMRGRLAATASTTANVNDDAAQQKAADFQAAAENLGQATDNLKTAWGALFSDKVIGIMNTVADIENWLANVLHSNQDFFSSGIDFVATALGLGPLVGMTEALKGRTAGAGSSSSSSSSSGSGAAPDSLASDQIMATQQLVAIMRSVHRAIIGGIARDNDAIPAGLQGANFNAYAHSVNTGIIRTGALG